MFQKQAKAANKILRAAREADPSQPPVTLWLETRARWLFARARCHIGRVSRAHNDARDKAVYALWLWSGGAHGLIEISKAVGIRSHSSTIYAINRVKASPLLTRQAETLLSEGRACLEAEYRQAVLRLAACGRT